MLDVFPPFRWFGADNLQGELSRGIDRLAVRGEAANPAIVAFTAYLLSAMFSASPPRPLGFLTWS